MSDIPAYGKKRDDGIRAAGVREPNFPPNYTAGSEELSFASDLIRDPADNNGAFDPAAGWDAPGQRASEV